MDKKKLVCKLFQDNYSAYQIHMDTGIGIKEVYHYIRESEELAEKHRKDIRAYRESYDDILKDK